MKSSEQISNKKRIFFGKNSDLISQYDGKNSENNSLIQYPYSIWPVKRKNSPTMNHITYFRVYFVKMASMRHKSGLKITLFCPWLDVIHVVH